MILERPTITPEELERRSGWVVTPEGACRGGTCVPLPRSGAKLDLRVVAERLGMPLVHDEKHGLWCLGPEAGRRTLADARLPELVLPDLEGQAFDVASLRGRKVLLLAWASW